MLHRRNVRDAPDDEIDRIVTARQALCHADGGPLNRPVR